MLLYRYISYEKFLDMIQKSQLYFANPFKEWDDKKEGYIFKTTQTAKGREKIISALNSFETTDEFKEVCMKYFKNEIYGIRCQSWTTKGNSRRLWKDYTNKDGVMIQSSFDKINSLKYETHSVELIKVKYRKISIYKDIKKAIDFKKQIIYFPFFLKSKRNKFEYEQEYRAYVIQTDPKDEGIFVDIPNLLDFIINVTPNPNSDMNNINKIKNICEKHGIKCSLIA